MRKIIIILLLSIGCNHDVLVDNIPVSKKNSEYPENDNSRKEFDFAEIIEVEKVEQHLLLKIEELELLEGQIALDYARKNNLEYYDLDLNGDTIWVIPDDRLITSNKKYYSFQVDSESQIFCFERRSGSYELGDLIQVNRNSFFEYLSKIKRIKLTVEKGRVLFLEEIFQS